jgi:hypothetical protein
MALQRMLARDVFASLAINTGSVGSPTWTEIGGITDVTPDASTTLTEDADYKSGGWAASKVAQRGRTMELKGNYLEDDQTGSQDAGQAALIALGDAVGYASNGQFRFITLGGNQTTFTASAEVVWGGGGTNDDGEFTAKLTVSGQPAFVPA